MIKLSGHSRIFWDMRWHDASLYGWAIENKGDQESDLLLDIDYIFAWIQPVPPSEYFNYCISPCTLLFNNVSSLHIYFDDDGYLDVMRISDYLHAAKTNERNENFRL